MDVLGYRGTTPPYFGNNNNTTVSKVLEQHDAEYIVPPRYQSDMHATYRRNPWLSSYHGPDSYYFPSSQLRHNIWLDQKNHDRVQNWLSEQHEFTGYPPPEEESICSLRSSSAVDVVSNDRSPLEETLGHFPKYKSEERIQSIHPESDEHKRAAAIKRYNSPDCMRRRYFSPRSDPSTLNTTGKQAFLTTRSASYKHLSPWTKNNESNPDYPLNRTFYHAGKGNTFPRRNKFTTHRNTSRNIITGGSTEEMGQQMEKYQQRVLLNPYASVNTNVNNNNNYEPFINDNKKDGEPLLAGRTFVLNGISLQSKQDLEVAASADKNSSVMANVSRTTHVPSTDFTDVTTTKTNEKSSGNSNKSDSHPLKRNVRSSFHIRVASAPATTDSNKLDRDLYWRSEETNKRRVSYEVRKVKAFSWPKRAVLPENTDLKFIENVTKRHNDRVESDSKSSEREETSRKNKEVALDNTSNSDDDDDGAVSDQSDIPPARPPLPAEHIYNKRDGSHSSVDRASSQRSSQYSQPPLQITEETIVAETKNDDYCMNEYRERMSSVYSSDNHSVSSEQHMFHNNSELSKRVSISLKDLIRIHEKEIARVSGAFSTRTLDKIEEKTRKTSFNREEPKRENTKWKRHTTIGLLGDFSYDAGHLTDSHVSSPDVDRDVTEHFEQQNNEAEGISSPLLSPISTSKKFNIIVSSRAASDGSEALPSPLSPRLERSFKSPPSTLPKPKKVTTSSMVTSPLQTVVAPPQAIPQTHGAFRVPCEMAFITSTSDSSVQTDDHFVRSPSFRKNEVRVKELTEENEKIKKAFEEERTDLNKKLQEQKKVANAYQKLEDRYRKKVYELQKAMKTCTCSTNRFHTYPGGENEHYRPDCSSVGDPNEISVQKVDGILNQLEAWLNHHTNGITYPESDISSIFGSTTEEIFLRNNKRSNDHYGGNGTIPLDRIIDRIDATSV